MTSVTPAAPPPAEGAHKRRRRLLTMTAALVASAVAAACGGAGDGGSSPVQGPTPTPAPSPSTLLVIGDSFTEVQGGIETHLTAIAGSMNPPRSITVDRVSQGGATLADLRQLPAVLSAVRGGTYDVVVVQDDLPEYGGPSVEPFRQQARWFDQEIRAHQGRPVLFMAWAYERLDWVTMDTIAQVHREMGAELGDAVAPVGLAFAASTAQRPDLAMLDTDLEHQTLAGMYLAACVVYATVFQESPVGAAWFPAGLSAAQAGYLQQVAWASVAG